MPAIDDIPALEQRRQGILRELASIGDLRPGSLVHRYMKCGTPSCRCRQPGGRGHGPYFVLVRHVKSKRTSRSVPAAVAATTQVQVDECRRFRRLAASLIEVSEQLCDARLASGADTPAAQKKSLRAAFRPHHRSRDRELRRAGCDRPARLRGAGDTPAAPGTATGGAGRGAASQ